MARRVTGVRDEHRDKDRAKIRTQRGRDTERYGRYGSENANSGAE